MSDTDFDAEDMMDPFETQLQARAAEARRRSLLRSRRTCVECDAAIPEPRRAALPGVRLCVDCQAWEDARRSRYPDV